MMKKRYASFVIASIFLLSLVSMAAAVIPEHTSGMGLLNDFAGSFDEASKARVENKLRSLEKQTGIEIAVVTVRNLDGMEISDYAEKLFKKWGIGKKKVDNGVLVLIATDVPGKSGGKGRRRIEVGYGLEGTLTDSISGRILKNNRPLFDQGKVAESTEGIVDNLIAHLSKQSSATTRSTSKTVPGQNASGNMPDADAKAIGGFFTVFLLVIGGIGVCVLIGFAGARVIKKIREVADEKRKREQYHQSLAKRVQGGKETIENIKSWIAGNSPFAEKFSTFPEWARTEINSKMSEIHKLLLRAENDYNSLEKESDPWELDSKLDESEYVIRNLKSGHAELLKTIESLPTRIKEVQEHIDNAKRAIEAEIHSIIEKMSEMDKAGFNRKPGKEDLQKYLEQFELLKKDSDQQNFNMPKVLKEIKDVLRNLLDISERMRQREKLSLEMAKIPGLVEDLKNGSVKYKSIIDSIKKDNPVENWQDLVVFYASFPALFSDIAALSGKIYTANLKGDDLAQIKNDYSEMQEKISSTHKTFAGIEERQNNIEKARSEHKKQLEEAQELIKRAERMVKHEDVDHSRKREIPPVHLKINEAITFIDKGGLINWLAVMALLTAAIKSAENIIAKSEADISAARLEIARRAAVRRAEDEKEAETSRQRRRDEESRTSYVSSNSSGGSGGGGDGGGFDLGGGGSGGGGADD